MKAYAVVAERKDGGTTCEYQAYAKGAVFSVYGQPYVVLVDGKPRCGKCLGLYKLT